jgi:cyanate permease
MALWKKLWLLFAVIWVVVAALNVITILAFAEDLEREKAWVPVLFAFAVPAALYLLGWLWEWFRQSRRRAK